MRWLIGIGGGSAVLCLIFLILPLMIRATPRSSISEARGNAQQLGLMLFEFQNEYGKFPDRSTIDAVRSASGTKLTLSDRTSNDLFAQMLVLNYTDTEKLFYAKAKGMKRRPDSVFNTDATILEHGECAFAFLYGLSITGDPNRPIAFGPVIPGTSTLDGKSCEGKAIILRMDNSTTTLPINSAGKIMENGFDLLDPRQPYWHGTAPDVKWPK